MRWSTTAGCRTSSRPGRGRHPSRHCRRRRWCSCLGVATARPTRCPSSPGTGSRSAPLGWGRVQAICDFVHQHIQFGYQFARATKTAFEAFNEREGVCRDFAHLAITLCRCMNIPARYCTGYLGDIGVPPGTRRWTSRGGSRPISRLLVHVRRSQQHPAHRTRPHRARPRRRRRGDLHDVRTQRPEEFQGTDGGSPRAQNMTRREAVQRKARARPPRLS